MRFFWRTPNIITGYRAFIAGPIVLLLYLWEFAGRMSLATDPSTYLPYQWLAVLGIVSAGASDGLDGWLARRYERSGWKTEFGQMFDPWADKVFGFACIPGIFLHLSAVDYLDMYAWITVLVMSLGYIVYYSIETTRMRRDGVITAPNQLAKYKTGLLTAGTLLGYGAFWMQGRAASLVDVPGAAALFCCGTLCVAGGAILSIWALEVYKIKQDVRPWTLRRPEKAPILRLVK